MAEKDLTRREAVGRLLKATLITTAAPYILIVQTTAAQSSKADQKPTPPTKAPDPKDLFKPTEGERVIVAAQGSSIAFTIIGPPGRYCRVAYAVEGSEAYSTPPGGAGVIGRDGRLMLSLDVRQFGNRRLLLGVRTSLSETLDQGVRATTPFEVSVQNGAVLALSGIRERGTIALSGAAACKAVAAATIGGAPRVR